MKKVPSYAKILTLGSAYTDEALKNEVVIQEKVDGSFFGFGLNEDHELCARSKAVQLPVDNYNAMFTQAMLYIQSQAEIIQNNFASDTYFFGEFLQKPKHNTLSYERIPQNHIVLFDALEAGKWVSREQLKEMAELLHLDVIPELFHGIITIEEIKELLNQPSFLGKEIAEGIVIKNYTQTILIGGQVMPLFTKMVREAFKERHTTDWKIRNPKDSLETYIKGFKSEPRWLKAFQYLRDAGELEISPRDIPKIIKRVQIDIVEEEQENIKTELYRKFIGDILRHSVAGTAEWYKDQLLHNIK